MSFEVGTHFGIKTFECEECAYNYYDEIEREMKYLKDCNKNIILLNTYGWKNG